MFALVFGLHFHIVEDMPFFQTFPEEISQPGTSMPRKLFAQVIERNSSVDQSAERHVAADSAKAIKISKFHFGLCPRIDTIGGQKWCQTTIGR